MAADIVLNAGTGGDVVRSIDKAGVKTQVVAIDLGGAGAESLLTTSLPVSGPLTDTQLRATAVPISGTVTASGPLTDTQLRATAVPISGTVTANAGTGTLAVSGPLTDTQLRATAVPISGTVTANAGTGTLAVSGPLTDTQLRATAVPISGTVTANAGTNLNTSALSTETTLAALNTKVTAVNTGAVVISSGAVTATDGGSGKTLKSAVVSLTATGTVIALVAGKRIKVYAIKLVCSAALVVNWRSGASTALEGAQSIAINGGYVENVNPPSFLFGTVAGESLDLVITGVGTAAGRVSYWTDDAA